MNPLPTKDFLNQLTRLLSSAVPADEIVRFARASLLRPLLVRGRRRSEARRGRSLAKALRPWTQGTLDGTHDAQRRAAGIFRTTMDVAETRVLRDLDPLIGAALLAMLDDDWTHLLHVETDERICAALFPRARDSEDTMTDFWGYELTTLYRKSNTTYLHEIERALRETGKAGGLLRTHARYYRSSLKFGRPSWSLGDLDELATSGDSPLLNAEISERLEAERAR